MFSGDDKVIIRTASSSLKLKASSLNVSIIPSPSGLSTISPALFALLLREEARHSSPQVQGRELSAAQCVCRGLSTGSAAFDSLTPRVRAQAAVVWQFPTPTVMTHRSTDHHGLVLAVACAVTLAVQVPILASVYGKYLRAAHAKGLGPNFATTVDVTCREPRQEQLRPFGVPSRRPQDLPRPQTLPIWAAFETPSLSLSTRASTYLSGGSPSSLPRRRSCKFSDLIQPESLQEAEVALGKTANPRPEQVLA
eukprot:CAMPEP_0198732656 /NCGR_PEP_ID=MMETSP1475-20131203/37645_1 /TAXON_ID= ORGANISM="Unidentified sp., Strain CCMP1999" /NCGR_SAMPLE_ID=MMETSP1475 /ASSEMBLY_ACC=CAM_ASM_001111 /LENGTH=251 /DNA_ID=CAMNT_0044495799 /DNA_START=129 /DNA_END=884 /DNA_ORIENTATION=-